VGVPDFDAVVDGVFVIVFEGVIVTEMVFVGVLVTIAVIDGV
jgi:hypothetical protein